MHRTSHLLFACLLLLSAPAWLRAQLHATYDATGVASDPHRTEEWALVAPHLPDALTSSPDRLETAGDVLRARRFPADAITYYKAAALNGGTTGRLLKKQGVVHLELQHGLLARLCFQQAVRANKRDAEAWNNLGASDFMLGEMHTAVHEYKRAVKLNGESAIYHSNLALAYFEIHKAKDARQEFARAMAIDPEVMHHNGAGGYNLQILASSHYPEICFEMARVYAAQGDAETTINWLTKASERGLDVRSAMANDPLLLPYLRNERVKLLLANVDHLHQKAASIKTTPPSLNASSSQ